MSNSLVVTTTLVDDHWLISATLGSGSTLPADIFIYENTGTAVLGTFYGTCSISDLTKFQVYTGTVIPIFGNRFLRYNTANIIIRNKEKISEVISILTKNVSLFSSAYTASTPISQTFPL